MPDMGWSPPCAVSAEPDESSPPLPHAASELGFVDEVAPEQQVLARAVEHAQGLVATRGRTLGEIKSSLYADAVASLRTPVANLESQEALNGG